MGKDAVLFVISLHLATFLLTASGFASVVLGSYTSPQSMVVGPDSFFNIENLTVLAIGTTIVGAVFSGLLSIVTKNLAYGAIAILIWVVSMMWKPLGWVVNATPLFLENIVLTIGGASPDAVIIAYLVKWLSTVLFVYIVFMFIIEIYTGRQL